MHVVAAVLERWLGPGPVTTQEVEAAAPSP